jgi:hypothetical protein
MRRLMLISLTTLALAPIHAQSQTITSAPGECQATWDCTSGCVSGTTQGTGTCAVTRPDGTSYYTGTTDFTTCANQATACDNSLASNPPLGSFLGTHTRTR